jgi:hypothetical protein
MRASLPIKHVILDFDGTCTQIPVVFQDYLDRFLSGLNKAGFVVSATEWSDAQALVRQYSPEAGWMPAGCPAAPVAADPYILADEAAKLIVRMRKDVRPLPNVHTEAYVASAAPWRAEALETFALLIERGVRIHFVSNSSSAYITGRVAQLVGTRQDLLSSISIQSDAGKFRICELSWPDQGAVSKEGAVSKKSARKFTALPAAIQGVLQRPIYLRRGAYFEAINKVLAGDLGLLANTLFCGDIWEMDLAMPYALGARVHLLDRAAPFSTYPYERKAIKACGARGKRGADLSGLLGWFD